MARYTLAVRDYLTACEANAAVLSKKYHPTEDGAVKIIFHRTPDDAEQIRDTFRAERRARAARTR